MVSLLLHKYARALTHLLITGRFLAKRRFPPSSSGYYAPLATRLPRDRDRCRNKVIEQSCPAISPVNRSRLEAVITDGRVVFRLAQSVAKPDRRALLRQPERNKCGCKRFAPQN